MNKSVLLAHCIIVVLLGIANTGNCNETEIHFHQLSLKHKDIQPYIYCTTQDSTGYMWFSSKGVIQRYDGVRLKTYNLNSLLSNANNLNIPELHVNGRYLWIGTHNGLLCFDVEKECIVPLTMEGTSINVLIKEIFTDKYNRLWIGTIEDLYIGEFDEQNKQLRVTQADAYIFPNKNTRMNYGQIRNICSDNKNKVWVATYERLFQFSMTNKKIRIENELITDTHNMRRFKDLEYYKDKLYAVKGKFVQIIDPPSSSHDKMRIVNEISLEKIVLEHRSRELTQYNDMVIDDEGNLWMITNFGVLNIRLNNHSYVGSTLYKQPIFYNQRLLSFKLNHIYRDASNCIWISSNAGDVFYISLTNQRFKHYNIQNNIKYANYLHKTRCFEVSENNTIWIGTYERGLFKYNTSDHSVQKFLFSEAKYKMFPGYIHALCYNNSNKVLAISSRRGLILHHTQSNENQFISQSDSSGFDRRVNKMVTDRHGNFWGTTNKSLLTFGKNEHGKYILMDTISRKHSFHLKSID
ncbi:MAG: hypothetical protein MI922_30350, partial [Bacteroidales bacterium]|nr:hypothetical protein [Bacteroidales bacterium]